LRDEQVNVETGTDDVVNAIGVDVDVVDIETEVEDMAVDADVDIETEVEDMAVDADVEVGTDEFM